MPTLRAAPLVEPSGHLQPNMLSLTADVTSSTFGNLSARHSIIAASTFFNIVFHRRTNFEGAQFVACEFGENNYRALKWASTRIISASGTSRGQRSGRSLSTSSVRAST